MKALHTSKKPQKCQQILMDMQGIILDSSDTIFAVERHRPLTEWSHFLASILPTLNNLKLDSPEIYFPNIDTLGESLSGLYDCSFISAEWEEGKLVLVWNILDLTKSESLLKRRQQKSQDRIIEEQLALPKKNLAPPKAARN
ncbi:MAG: hypothetical protein U5L45_05055 [Saprospiraceae bacterium]|nr:hypothetical protein [Saprospiraceae bacterium]